MAGSQAGYIDLLALVLGFCFGCFVCGFFGWFLLINLAEVVSQPLFK